MPKLAVFPKAYMDALCVEGSMTLEEWIVLASSLPVDGLEFYAGFLELNDQGRWEKWKYLAQDYGLQIPMLCCSPDFTHPDAARRQQEVQQQKAWIDLTVALGGQYCRVLSGQRRPELGLEEGINYTVECIEACLNHASSLGISLVMENHYKDNYWTYPEFAQKSEVFCAIVNRIQHPNFGVNYDPSNAFLAGEDPLDLLKKVRDRVRTMHASDRYLAVGTLEDLRQQENSLGYAQMLRHGEIGRGLNDYDQIFRILRATGFDGWISIEDGVDGFDQLERSAGFLRKKISEYWWQQDG